MDQPQVPETKRKEGSPNPDSQSDYQFQRRLVVCLDGTWNQRDSGTNIYHLSNLILEGKIEPIEPSKTPTDPTEIDDPVLASRREDRKKTWVQMVYYDEGVGTGLLDSATGGAFGIGLSENVRQAYDWLVERYREGDHVYVFGFSRGAFTARSLVGMITTCGLLYRGAPLPQSELWKGYKEMAPYPPPLRADGTRVPPKKWWQPFGAQRPGPFRPLNRLKPDEFPGAKRYQFYIPWIKMSEREKLLRTWSRRIPIRCLAVYDTVRTLGIEALAIPWLRERRAEFHNTELTWLIKQGFHGLAIDEHRANFSHVPWRRKTKLNTAQTDAQAKSAGEIKQRWFVGAHSNIGGSYDDDTLAQRPLAWFIEECTKLGLVFKPRRKNEPDVRKTELKDCIPLWPLEDKTNGVREEGHICDSHTEFALGLWRHILRAKRNYRRIEPLAEFRGGEEFKSLNETLDDSVLDLVRLNAAKAGPENYNPPNLYEYRKRKGDRGLIEPPHEYCAGRHAKKWLAGWLFGIACCGELIALLMVGWKWHWLNVLLPVLSAALAGFGDWWESFLNHEQALKPEDADAEMRDGLLDLLLNVRLIAIGDSVVGAGFFLWLVVYGLSFPLPLSEAMWLLAFCGMMTHFNASKMWAAQPMREANFGSIVSLQQASTPEQVSALRQAWMELRLPPSNRNPSPAQYHLPDPHRLLPVHRTLWRDMIGFIPAYSLAFGAGLWVTFSLLHGWFCSEWCGQPFLGLLSRCCCCWGPAVAIVAIAALADYLEDAIHLRYLKQPEQPPSKNLVRIGRIATVIKTVACLAGFFGMVAAILLLGLLQFCRAIVSACPCLACDSASQLLPPALSSIPAIFSIAAALAAIILAYSTVRAFFQR